MKEHIFVPQSAIGRLWYTETPNLDYYHRHDVLECNIVCRGSGSYIVGDQRIDLVERSIAWLFPGQDHLLLNQSADFTLWIFVIRPEYLRQSCTDDHSRPLLEQNPAGLHVRHLKQNRFDQLHKLCQQAILNEEKQALYNAALGYLLHASWNSYQHASLIPLSQQVHPAINKIARRFLDGNTGGDLTALSKEVGLSPETISRLFKKQTGFSISAYRNRCRLNRFFDLYDDGHQMTLLEAALAAGFGSYAQFYRVFCYSTGQTPAAYRRTRIRSSAAGEINDIL